MINDTSPQAQAILNDLLRSAPIWRKVQMIDELNQMVRSFGTIARFGLTFHCQIRKYINIMDKNNCKLKMLYKCIKATLPVPCGIVCCIYHQLKYSSPNRSKKPPKTGKSHTEEPFGKSRFMEKENVRKMGQKQKRIRQKERDD